MQQQIIIGTRGSQMALYQAQLVKKLLTKKDQNLNIQIKVIKVTGDSYQGDLKKIGGKGLFIKQLDKALLNKEVDLAVNCMKDIPCDSERGTAITIGAVLPREDAREALITRPDYDLSLLNTKECVIGTSAPRRAAILAEMYPNATIKPIRGTAETRINKVLKGEFDATILCYGGLHRIGKTDCAQKIYEPTEFNPALGSGVITIDHLAERSDLAQIIKLINCTKTFQQVQIERSIVNHINGNCFTALACNITDTHISATHYKDKKKLISDTYSIKNNQLNQIGELIAKAIK